MKLRSRKIGYSLLMGFFSLAFMYTAEAQIGLGRVTGLDLYQHHRVPDHDGVTGHSVGSAVANIVLGPKVWVGGKSFSVSAQGAASFAPFAFDMGHYKGLGAVSFPISVDLNFLGLSGFSVVAKSGFSVGAGMSFHRTELYFVKKDYARAAGFYKVYYGQIAYGVGSGGHDLRLNLRYGQGENSSHFISAGILLSTNYFTGAKKPLGN